MSQRRLPIAGPGARSGPKARPRESRIVDKSGGRMCGNCEITHCSYTRNLPAAFILSCPLREPRAIMASRENAGLSVSRRPAGGSLAPAGSGRDARPERRQVPAGACALGEGGGLPVCGLPSPVRGLAGLRLHPLDGAALLPCARALARSTRGSCASPARRWLRVLPRDPETVVPGRTTRAADAAQRWRIAKSVGSSCCGVSGPGCLPAGAPRLIEGPRSACPTRSNLEDSRLRPGVACPCG